MATKTKPASKPPKNPPQLKPREDFSQAAVRIGREAAEGKQGEPIPENLAVSRSALLRAVFNSVGQATMLALYAVGEDHASPYRAFLFCTAK